MGFIDPAMLDPNVMYLVLLLGLWLGVTAAYIPGTGIAETFAFLLLAGGIFLLTLVATNWLAVLALVLGVSAFLILPFFGQRYRRYAEAGLIFQVLGGYFLFEEMQVSPVIIGITVVLAVMYNRFVLLPIIRSHGEDHIEDANDVIGKHGRVVTDIDPVGVVYVNREQWRARSDDYLPKDTTVVVTGQVGLELQVEKAKRHDERDSIERLKMQDIPPKQGQNGASTR